MNDFSEGLSRFFQEASKLPLLTAQQEVELGRRAQKGDLAARNKLVEHNLKLGIKVAKAYRGRGVPFEDLVQHSAQGLIRAATKFDPERGYRFTTYAMWWLHHHLQRGVQNEGATIRTPGHVTIRRARVQAALADATHRGLTPSVEELAEVVGCKPNQVKEALAAGRVVASLDVPAGTSPSGDEINPYESIPDPNAVLPDASLVPESHLREAMKQLTEEERRVLELRFGFHGREVALRDDVAKTLGIEPYAVGRAQKSGLAKLEGILLSVGHSSVPEGETASVKDQQGASLLRPDRGLAPLCSRPKPKEL